MANPFLGVLLHTIGGFASGSFYLPYKKVKKWNWETYWLAGGVFSWIIAPWFFALMVATFFSTDPATGMKITVSVPAILREAWASQRGAVTWAYLFGAMWGVGGLTFGLTMRYLGMSLGMAVALGFCAFFGTLIPPLLGMFVDYGWFGSLKQYLPQIYEQNLVELLKTTSGQVTIGGLGVCLAGIALCGKAGMKKEREQTAEQKKASVAEFSFAKGMWVAVFSGIMSAGMSYAIASGKPIAEIAKAHGMTDVLKNIPVLIVVLLGGFTINFIWCVILHIMNGSARDYVDAKGASISLNYLFSAIAGTTWYLQFFFYSMGTTKMGDYDFASWTLHMATIIIFSNMWGLILGEWRGSSKRVYELINWGIAVLVASTVVVGTGTWMKEKKPPLPAASAPTATQAQTGGQ